MFTLPETTFRLLLLKSGPGSSGAKIAHSGKHALYGDPPRWHLVTAEKPAPKGAPIAAHPHSAGQHAPAEHFTPEQWDALKLSDANVNAPVFNKALNKLKQWSDAGNVTAILGAQYGVNTYGKKLATIANHLLGLHGSPHKVTPGQKPGKHAAVQSEPTAPHPSGLPEHLSPKDPVPPTESAHAEGTKWVMPLEDAIAEHKELVAAAESPSKADDKKQLAEQKAELSKMQVADGALAMPEFQEGKTTTGVKALYEKTAQKLMDQAHAGNLSVVEGMPDPGKKMWQGKTANSKKLLALHTEAVASLKGAGVPGIDPAAPAPAAELGKLAQIPWAQQMLPTSNTNAASHNKAVQKIKAMAEAGDVAGLQAFANAKVGAKQGYAKKQGLLAQLALAALKESGAPAAESAPAAAEKAQAPEPSNPAAAEPVPKTQPPAALPKTRPAADASKLTADQLEKLQSVPWSKLKLPDSNTNAKSHNAAVAKIEAMAFAGDKAGLQAFIDLKAGAKQTYAKKQHLLAQAALAALNEGGSLAAQKPAQAAKVSKQTVDNSPAPAKAAKSVKKDVVPFSDGFVPVGTVAKGPSGKHFKKGSDGKWSNAENGTTYDPYSLTGAYIEVTAGGKPDLSKFSGDDLDYIALKAMQNGLSVNKALHAVYDHQGPKEGDTKVIYGVTYVLKGGRWHKVGEDSAPAATASSNNASSDDFQDIDTLVDEWKDNIKAGKAPTKSQAKAYQKLKESNPDVAMEHLVELASDLLIRNNSNGNLDDEEYNAALDQSVNKVHELHRLGLTSENFDRMADPTINMSTLTADSSVIGNITSMDSWKQVGGQSGSNPGGKFKDPTGQEWYCKWSGDAEATKSEVLAAKLYALAGFSSQDCMLVDKGGNTSIATKWTDIKKASSAAALAKVDGVLSGFAVDAWLGNWDVVGQSLDNLQIGPDGKAHRVDAGGSLEYRAQGNKKPFGSKVDEIDTLRDPKKNPKAAAVFGKMTKADITASVAKVAVLDDDVIRALVMQHGPGDGASRQKLADTLIARKQDLLAQFPKAKPATPKPAAPVFRIPDRPNFSNWNGPGNGLSSKAAINQQNDALTTQIFKLGQGGDVEKLKAMTFQPIDAAGNPKGDPKPILQHPSQHIIGYYKDVLHAMQIPYLSPKIALAKAKNRLSSAFKAVSTLFPAFKSLKDAAVQIGRYALLGKAKPGNPLSKWKPQIKSRKQGTIDEVGLFNASQKAFSALSETEKKAIRDYTGSSYASMNNALMHGFKNDKAYNATNGMEKASVVIPSGTVLSRRFSLDKDESGDQSKELHDAAMQKIIEAGEGAILQDFGIISTSCRSTFWSGYVHLKITVGEGVKGLYVAADPSGKNIKPPISKNPGESEIMLPPGTRFMITKIHQKGHKFLDESGSWGTNHNDEYVIEVTALPNV